jgi:hypothetical protein
MNPKGNTVPIQVPKIAIKGETPITAEWANMVRSSIQRLGNRRNAAVDDNGKFYITPPFWPTFYGKPTAAGDYFVSLSHGVVIDHNPADGVDAILYYECDNELTAGLPTEFEIHDGEGIFVAVTLDENWAVIPGTPPHITIEAKGIDSWNPFSSGGGTHYYKIATLDIVAGEPIITRYAAGDNIWHYRQAAEQGAATGGDLNLTIEPNWFHAGYSPASPAYILYWRNGLFIGDAAPAGAAPAGLIENTVAGNP